MYSSEPKVNTTKTKFPIKTKIAVLWLFVAVAAMTFLVMSNLSAMMDWSPIKPAGYLLVVAVGLLFISPSILLCFKNKVVWISSIMILSVEVLLGITATGYVTLECSSSCFDLLLLPICYIIILIIPLVLIILDRKNYFEMVRQREFEKKENG